MFSRQHRKDQDGEEGSRQSHHRRCYEHARMAAEPLADACRDLDRQSPRRDAGRDDILIVRALCDELAVFHDFLLNDGNQSIAAPMRSILTPSRTISA